MTAITCALALALAAQGAHAQQADPNATPAPDQGGEHRHGGGGQRGFDAMDTNHDGFITLDEWKAAGRSDERFAEIDANHDGKITRDELRAFMEYMRARREQNGGGGGGGEHNDGH
jgi:opacity protein-like surface antigen